MSRQACVYMLASRPNGTLYIGVTSNLPQRLWQHRTGLVEGFTKRYGVTRLVWYELHQSMDAAIVRERQMKGVALEHRAHLARFAPSVAQILGGRADRIKVEVETHDGRPAIERPETVAAFAATRVEEKLPGLEIKPLEIDGQKHR